MGRCGGWSKGITLALAVIAASCGGTGGGPSDSGKPLVFQARGRLNLIVQPTNDPRVVTLTATLLDPQGIPFRNQAISFTAEFQDATFIPGSDNQGSVLTNDTGQAKITLVAGLTTGHMRVLAEAPPALNIATGITVELTAQGFVSLGPLGIIPLEVTFINPLVGPDIPDPMTIFHALGGTPPYRWNNSNKSLGTIEPIGLPNINEQATYTLIGPIPADPSTGALQDIVRLLDADGEQATATVNVIFADCALTLSATDVNYGGAVGGEQFDIVITNGVPPFTATNTFPVAGSVSVNQQTATVTYTIATPPVGVDPDTVLIRDSRGCSGTVEVTIVPAPGPTVTTILLEASPPEINGITGGVSNIIATVLDEDNRPIAGVRVLFTDDSVRATLSPVTATTGPDGRASTSLSIPPLTPAGVVRVTGSARGVSGFVDVAIFTTVTGDAGPPEDIFVELFTGQVINNSDGTCTAILSALIVDAEGNPVEDGTPVSWQASRTIESEIPVAVSSPSFTGQAPPSDCNLGNLQPIPQPGDALTCLKYPQSASDQTALIHATAGGIDEPPCGDPDFPSPCFLVTLPPCPSSTSPPSPSGPTLSLSANPPSISTGQDSTITATLLNANNQPIVGALIAFTTTRGTIIGSLGITSSEGRAVATLATLSSTEPGTASVTGTVASGDATGTFARIDITITP
jgi:hypothetical protein